MRNVPVRTSYPVIICILLSLFTYFSCSKSDRSPDAPVTTAPVEDGYFKVSGNTDVTVAAVARMLNRQNDQNNFKEELIHNAGYAQWGFAKTSTVSTSSRGVSEEEIINIPFVKRGVNATSAILVARLNSIDTVFQLMYPQHYILYGMSDSAQNSSEGQPSANGKLARDFFNVFAGFDYDLFGIKEYKINDGRIFGFQRNDTLTATIERTGGADSRVNVNTVNTQNAFFTQLCNTITTCHNAGPPTAKANNSQICFTANSCASVWVEDASGLGGGGSGSSGGNGGTGGGGSGSGGNNGGGGTNILVPTTPCKRIANMSARPGDPCSAVPWVPVDESDNNFVIGNNPVDVADGPFINYNNGVTITEIPLGTPMPASPRLIGSTNDRGNTEDLTYGKGGDITNILPSEVRMSNDQLWVGMKNLIGHFTLFSGDLNDVGLLMIQKFKTNTSNTSVFTNETLNEYVQQNANMQNFMAGFADQLKKSLKAANGDINKVQKIDLKTTRPIFDGTFNLLHGLKILINDTELTEITLNSFELSATKTWEADVTFTVHDHFGLDRHDVLKYQGTDRGFADWWLLQNTRGYIPFHTKIVCRERISGNLE